MSPIFFTIVFSSVFAPVSSQPSDYPTANLSTLWFNNNVSVEESMRFWDGSIVRYILRRTHSSGLQFVSGFYDNRDLDSYLFVTFIIYAGEKSSSSLQVVWSAKQHNPVGMDATLELTVEGDLVLRDTNGTFAWSTNTAGRSVAGLNLTEVGNLVLIDDNHSVVWQSFDHPTDCWLPGQILASGMNLTASASSTRWTEGGLYSVSMTDKGLVASIASPPQVYYDLLYAGTKKSKQVSYAKFQNGSIGFYINRFEPLDPDVSIIIPEANSTQFMKLGPDGHLRVVGWNGSEWNVVDDLFRFGVCNHPMVCGKYGICLNGQCSCPRSRSSGATFWPIDDWRPQLGCSEIIPLTCNVSDHHRFLDLDVTYFSFVADINNTDMKSCKEACLKNCSCKAAILRYGSNSSIGNCYLPSQIFSLINNGTGHPQYNSWIALKVQIPPNSTPPTAEIAPTSAKGKSSLLVPILGSTLGVFVVAAVLGTACFIYRRRRRRSVEVKEDYLDDVPDMPTRFSFKELATATDNFNIKLGEGGFGSVFEGLLNDGTRIAVKHLDGVAYVKKSFLAEVQTIGRIHHINLVRLIGFCAEKSHKLLVYEYMSNGSLEKWIYCRSQERKLDWIYRRKIILDIAKGLTYLHEECRQKIIHLDIKPQNILLDEHYNAKLADFGLSKLIDRNQSQVVTTMRGTPGYLAPEWLSAVITEKVDVYSFGVVILEIVCGRKVFERSMPEDERYLLTLFKTKAEEGHWLDLVDKCCLNVDSNVAEVEDMMQISAWCLQSHYEKRPSMSMMIKVLEGVKDVPRDIDYNFITPQYLISEIPKNVAQNVSPVLPSVLSGPR